MKQHEPKNRDKTSAKKKGDKKPNWKKEKRQSNTKKKNEKGWRKRKKLWTKDNKREGTEDQGSDTWIADFHSLLSNASSLMIL
jgi:hypothetical protein